MSNFNYSQHNFNSLTKHTYPTWIKLSFSLIIILFLYGTPAFILYELPQLQKIKTKMDLANNCFNTCKLSKAFDLYKELIDQYPSYSEGKLNIARICFSFTRKSSEFYFMGLEYLEGQTLPKSTKNELKLKLPMAYWQDFENHFIRA